MKPTFYRVERSRNINGEEEWSVISMTGNGRDCIISHIFKVESNAYLTATLLDDYWVTPFNKDQVQKERIKVWDEMTVIMRERGIQV